MLPFFVLGPLFHLAVFVLLHKDAQIIVQLLVLMEELLWVYEQVGFGVHNLVLHEVKLQLMEGLLEGLECLGINLLLKLLYSLLVLIAHKLNVLHILVVG